MNHNPLDLYKLFLGLQKKRRMLALALGVSEDEAGVNLGYVEEAVLRTLDFFDDQNVKELAEGIGVERSWMSRVVSTLLERGLLEAFTPETDRRSKRLRITVTGNDALHSLEDFVRAVIDETLRDLKEQQILRLAEVLTSFADALGASRSRVGKRSHPVHVQLSRISRALGVFGSNIMGSGLHLSQVYVLEQLYRSDTNGVSINDLNIVIPLDVSTISRTVSGLVKSGLVVKKRSETDRRSVILRLSSKGKEVHTDYRRRVERIFGTAMAQLSESETQELFSLLRVVTAHMPVKNSVSDETLVIRSLAQGTPDKNITLLLETVVGKLGRAEAFSEKHVLFQNEEPVAVCLVDRDFEHGAVREIVLGGKDVSEKECAALLARVF